MAQVQQSEQTLC